MNTPLEERLRTELQNEAGGVEPRAGYVTSTVHTVLARRRRRQLGTVAAAVAAVAVIGAGGVTLDSRADDDGAPATPADSPTPSEPTPPAPTLDFADIQRIPPQQRDWDALPWRDTALPHVLPSDVATAPALSQDPIDHALALVAGPSATVGVVGDDGQLRRLDGVTLEPARDPSGYRSSPVTHGSLTPDGSLAAFPQPGEVVVVDLASGSSERFDVPGRNTRVLWHPDLRYVLIGREGARSSLLDLTDGSVEDAPYDAYGTAFAPDGAVLELQYDQHSIWPNTLVRWDGDVEQDRIPLSIWDGGETSPSAKNGRLVVAASVEDVDPSESMARAGEGWVVLDIETGEPTSMLRMPQAWYQSWLFGPCGWLDADTVLLTAPAGLVAWTPGTGALERVTETDSYFDLSLATDTLD